MDTDQWIKIVPIASTIMLGASTLWLSIKQYLDGNKNARREEYKFAKLFFDELEQKPGMHPFARKKGFQAIGRNQDVSPAVIEYLMDLHDPVLALSDYEFSRGYLKHIKSNGRRQLDFAGLFVSTERRRKFLSAAYLLGALVMYIFAFAPWLLQTIGQISMQVAISASIVFVPIGISFTIVLMWEFFQLLRAIRLVKTQNQEAESQEIAEEERD